MTTRCPGCAEQTLDFQLLDGDRAVPRSYFKQFTVADLMVQGCACPLTEDEIERAGAELLERVNSGRMQ